MNQKLDAYRKKMWIKIALGFVGIVLFLYLLILSSLATLYYTTPIFSRFAYKIYFLVHISSMFDYFVFPMNFNDLFQKGNIPFALLLILFFTFGVIFRSGLNDRKRLKRQNDDLDDDDFRTALKKERDSKNSRK